MLKHNGYQGSHFDHLGHSSVKVSELNILIFGYLNTFKILSTLFKVTMQNNNKI